MGKPDSELASALLRATSDKSQLTSEKIQSARYADLQNSEVYEVITYFFKRIMSCLLENAGVRGDSSIHY